MVRRKYQPDFAAALDPGAKRCHRTDGLAGSKRADRLYQTVQLVVEALGRFCARQQDCVGGADGVNAVGLTR